MTENSTMIDVRPWTGEDGPALAGLWQAWAPAQGYGALAGGLWEQPGFDPGLTFLSEARGKVRGAVLGCRRGRAGYLACLPAPEEDWDPLLTRLEGELERQGAESCEVSFRCPMALPWVMPGTGGALHNNRPGAPEGSRLSAFLKGRGYAVRTVDQAMYLDLREAELPEIPPPAGYRVVLYQKAAHPGMEELLEELGSEVWKQQIPAFAAEYPMLAVLEGDRVAGFAGPVYPEPSGRGFFAGIGVSARCRGLGLGKCLFFRLCREEKARGAKYMSLFTGTDNPAGKLYGQAGFRTAARFETLKKRF